MQIYLDPAALLRLRDLSARSAALKASLENTPGDIAALCEEMVSVMQRGSPEELYDLAHSMKGIAATTAAGPLQTIAIELMEETPPTDLEAQERLRYVCDKTIEAIKQTLRE